MPSHVRAQSTNSTWSYSSLTAPCPPRKLIFDVSPTHRDLQECWRSHITGSSWSQMSCPRTRRGIDSRRSAAPVVSTGSPRSALHRIGTDGTEKFVGVLGQCSELNHLNLRGNQIGAGGVESIAKITRVLVQCVALSHLNLSYNGIDTGGTEKFAGVLEQCTTLVQLNLSGNQIGPTGSQSLEGVLTQCATMTDLHLRDNQIRTGGTEKLVGVNHHLCFTSLVIPTWDLIMTLHVFPLN